MKLYRLVLLSTLLALESIACALSQSGITVPPALKKLSASDIPPGFAIKGEIKESYGFIDASGENRIFVAIHEIGKPGENQKSEISAIQMTNRNGGFVKTWKLWDFSGNILESVEYESGQIDILDIDGDGKMEVSLWYQKIQDGNDPDTLKFFVYQQEKKFAIRGQIPKVAEDVSQYERKIDNALVQGPKPILKYARAKWDSIAKPMLNSARQIGSDITE